MAKNTITLQQAQEWAAAWRSNPNNTVKAFLIPNVDLTQLLAEEGVQDVRAYVGIDGNNEQKLMLVGVDDNGNDLINEAKGQFIYDFTQPCPEKCDINSPLFNLK
ncbi:hypothetical protein [Flavobacterium sp. N2270]|uniref:hypothetical protein n=1 Tax=Flavobacterium sp. N2270 TaxID=2986831 RepID=UPI0022253DC2|nr:hypothetical protein [Flavobacterium sp. N2270]